ncbi:hypothetical protein QCA50_013725 [Cerrena zonata]|uniref:DUF6533 domain-containing protein n=1 Tax=Cerrena zonata TaxID=2478898 RepID=A0AAW0FPT3_9APHY
MANREDPVFIIRSQDYNRASIAACIGVLYYDFALTLGSEVRLYWRKEKWSWTRSFFFLNRYTALAAHVPIAFEFFLPDLSEKRYEPQ